MDNTEIAIVFLDQDLRIKTFTPAIANIFPLREGDRGRPLMQIVSNLIDSDVTGDLDKVQRTLDDSRARNKDQAGRHNLDVAHAYPALSHRR